MSDRIVIRDLQVFARHGLLPEEKALGQRFALDITAYLDLAEAGRSDDLAHSVSYVDLIETATATLMQRRFDLIEAAAESVAAALLAGFPTIERVAVELRKPAAPINAVFAHVGVAIERSRA
jgi:7,8-dihydroneopterin aldolase/epimerase/oxygenase